MNYSESENQVSVHSPWLMFMRFQSRNQIRTHNSSRSNRVVFNTFFFPLSINRMAVVPSQEMQTSTVDARKDNFTLLAERSVRRELAAHLDNMAVFRALQRISGDRLLTIAKEMKGKHDESLESSPCEVDEEGGGNSRELVVSLEDLTEGNAAYVDQANKKDALSSKRNRVSVVACDSRITTQLHGEVLTEYDTVWAYSTATLAVDVDATSRRRSFVGVATRGAAAGKERVLVRLSMESMHLVNRRRTAEEAERQAALLLKSTQNHANSSDETLAPSSGSAVCPTIDDLDDGNSWFAIQSVRIPESPLDLQCYSRHMVHFGMLCYALWFSGESHDTNKLLDGTQSHKESYRALMALFPHAVNRHARQNYAPERHSTSTVLDANLHEKRGRLPDTSDIDCSPTKQNKCDTNPTINSSSSSSSTTGMDLFARNLALPTESDTPILILGLGGNVIGTCLDSILPTNVPIDIVELEPTVVRACEMHGTLPTLESEQHEERSTVNRSAARTLCAERGHPRYPNYRVFVGEVSRTLPLLTRTGCRGESHAMYYRMIFLDCYDPQRETMMCEGSLLRECRERLCPVRGGVLIVNAHITPTKENLQPFEACNFASVQVLRVLGCDQCILACFTDAHHGTGASPRSVDTHDDMVSAFPVADRFTVPSIRHMGRCINQLWERIRHRETKDVHWYPFREHFPLDADWFQSSRALSCCEGNVRLWQLNP